MKKIGVIYGGRSKERPGSIKSGLNVINALESLGYSVIAIDTQNEENLSLLKNVDLAFIALHGWYGEDGKIQGYLETLSIPYTGCGVLSSALCMDKVAFKRILSSQNINTPKYEIIKDNNHDAIFDKLGFPLIVKPINEGGSLGISIVNNEVEFKDAIIKAKVNSYNDLFAEEFIDGDFLTVGLLGSFNTPNFLSILQIKFEGLFYDYEIKHTKGAAQYILPAEIPKDIFNQIKTDCEKIYIDLYCNGPIRVDLMLSKDLKPYYIEVNTVPGLSDIGNLPAIANSVGIDYNDLLIRIIDSAYTKPNYTP